MIPALDCNGDALNGIKWYFNLKGSVIDGTFVPIGTLFPCRNHFWFRTYLSFEQMLPRKVLALQAVFGTPRSPVQGPMEHRIGLFKPNMLFTQDSSAVAANL